MNAGARRDRPPLEVHAALVAVQLLFAGFAVVGKAVLATVPPFSVAACRVLGATPLLLVLAMRSGKLMPERRDWPRLVLLGLLGVAANQTLFILGLQRTSATNASILMPSIPVFAAAFAATLGIERLAGRQVTGIALAIAGSLVLLHPGRMTLAPGTAIGNAMILGNCMAYALFLVLQRDILTRLPWTTVIAWSFVFGGVPILPLAAHDLARMAMDPPGWGAWLGLGYIVVLSTFVGYALNTWAIHRSTPSLVAAYTTLQPFFAAALAVGLLGEKLGWEEAVGFACIAGGLTLVTRRRDAAALDTAAGRALERPLD